MARRSPLMELHTSVQALVSPFALGESDGQGEAGPARAGGASEPMAAPVMVVEAIEPVEIEYAAIRRGGGAAVLDRPERGMIEVRGSDRLDFLNRMLTQELRAFESGTVRRALWLNRKGRIDADLTLVNLPDRLLMETDVFAVEHTIRTLREFVFAEDIEFADATETTHRLSLHGPAAAVIAAGLAANDADRQTLETISADRSVSFQARAECMGGKAGVTCTAWRRDEAGEIGVELLVPAPYTRAVYEAISDAPVYVPGSGAEIAGKGAERAAGQGRNASVPKARRVGWHAFNIARIEAGTALFRFDFGPTNLPHELGRETLGDRVSFKKGCYLGQEVVARMESLGHPKQRLVGLRFEPPTTSPTSSFTPPTAAGGAGGSTSAGELSPLHAGLAEVSTGCTVLQADEPDATVVGAVTSAAASPMLGSRTLAFAMVRWSHAQEGTRVWVQVGGARITATVSEKLRAWGR